MSDKGIDLKMVILLYMLELEKVQNYIDNISKKSANAQVLNYLQRRKQSIQYEIQEHAKHLQEVYKKKLEEIKGLIEREENKVTRLEESTAIKGINPETLLQEIIEGEEGEKIDLFVSKGVIEDLTKVFKYLQGEIEYYQEINNKRENKTTDGFSSYEEEIEIIENIAGKFEIEDDDMEIGRYLNRRKYAIYYKVQTAIDQEVEKYTKKLEEIENLILYEHEKQAEFSEMRDFLISTGVIEDLLKIRECLKQNIKFLESIDIERNGLPNIENQLHNNEEEREKANSDDNNVKEDAPKDEQEMSIVLKQTGRLDFIKNAWNNACNKIKKKLTKKSRKNETDTNKDENTGEKPKEESIRDRLGGYNESQNEFEKNAMNAVKQKEQFNSESKIKIESEYVD